MMNRLLYAMMICVAFIGCQKGQVPEPLKKSQIIASTPSKLRPEATLVTYENGDRGQIENDQEVAHFRKPTEQESILQYWKQRYPNTSQVYEALSGSGSKDQPPLYQLKIPNKGVTVIYNSQTDRVEEVIEYAPL